MKRWNHMMVAVCMAAAAVACSGDPAPADTARADRPEAVGTSGEAKAEAGRADRDFVGDMLAGGRAEVDLGKLAQQKARNKQVKDFAAMMVRDHTKAAAELKTVATQANIDVTTVDADMGDNKDAHDRLAGLSGMEFDREYMQMMVDKHEKTVDELESKAERADNDHVKQWAAKALPTVKKHLEQARQIDESLEKRSGS